MENNKRKNKIYDNEIIEHYLERRIRILEHKIDLLEEKLENLKKKIN